MFRSLPVSVIVSNRTDKKGGWGWGLRERKRERQREREHDLHMKSKKKNDDFTENKLHLLLRLTKILNFHTNTRSGIYYMKQHDFCQAPFSYKFYSFTKG